MMFEFINNLPYSCNCMKCNNNFLLVANESCVTQIDEQNRIACKYFIHNVSSISLYGNNKIALKNTSGMLSTIDLDDNSITCFDSFECTEGNPLLSIANNVWWTDWDGKLFCFESDNQKVVNLNKLPSSFLMPIDLMATSNYKTLYISSFNRKTCKAEMFKYCIAENTLEHISMPIKKTDYLRCCINNKNEIIVYDGHANTISSLTEKNSSFVIEKTVLISKKYGVFDRISAFDNYLAIWNSSYVIIVDQSNGKQVFEYNDNYISDICFSNKYLIIGTWEKCSVFSINKTSLI